MQAGREITLPGQQSHHLVNVLRLKNGAEVELVDGKGTVARGNVAESSPHASKITIQSVDRIASHSRVTLAFAIPKGAALDLIVRKCTEVGLMAFQPLITRHSINPDHWNEERWDKVVNEVIKQCQAPHAPIVYPPKTLEDWIGSRDESSLLVFCHEDKREKKSAAESRNTKSQRSCDLLVGSEGGWSKEETERIEARGAIPLSLGANRLRAETAALVALVLTKKDLGEL